MSTRRSRIASSSDVVAACRERWGESSALFEQVGNSVGTDCNRHADVVAMGLWPSRGLWLEGVEIKVSRSDWLTELRKPGKADPIAQYCDFWWLAVGDASIVQEGELPERWGLLILEGGKLRAAKAAPKLDAQPLDRKFVAALLRRAANSRVHEAIRLEAFAKGREQGLADAPEQSVMDRTNAERDLERLRESLAAFEASSGIKIESWNGESIGAAVRRVQELRRYRRDAAEIIRAAAMVMRNHAEELDGEAGKLAKELTAVRSELKAVSS